MDLNIFIITILICFAAAQHGPPVPPGQERPAAPPVAPVQEPPALPPVAPVQEEPVGPTVAPVAPVQESPAGAPVAPVQEDPAGAPVAPVAPVQESPAGAPVAPVQEDPAGAPVAPVAPVQESPAGAPVAPVQEDPAGAPVAPVQESPTGSPVAPVQEDPAGAPVAPVAPVQESPAVPPVAPVQEDPAEAPVAPVAPVQEPPAGSPVAPVQEDPAGAPVAPVAPVQESPTGSPVAPVQEDPAGAPVAPVAPVQEPPAGSPVAPVQEDPAGAPVAPVAPVQESPTGSPVAPVQGDPAVPIVAPVQEDPMEPTAAPVQGAPAVKPSPPQNVLFKLTSHESFALSWSAPLGPLDYYLLHYFPDGHNKMEITISKTETHYNVINPNLDLEKLGVNLFSVSGDEVSEKAKITVQTGPNTEPTAAPAQGAPAVKPSPPQNVQFQLTSHDSFVLSWSAPAGPLEYYLIHYFPDGKTQMEVTVNKSETHYDVVNSDLDLPKLGVNLFSVFGDEVSEQANVNVLKEHDPRLPPAVTSATKQWISDSAVQLQWVPPEGVYDFLLLLYAPAAGGVTAQSQVLPKSETSYKITGLKLGVNYTIHLYTIRNGIHSDPPVFTDLMPHVGQCTPNPCKHDGQCTEGSNEFTCECKQGYIGILCENFDESEFAGVAGLRASSTILSLMSVVVWTVYYQVF
ncbi:uncharacterized protein [Amphiura filiformis]|uniref:uncharacterized protein n=1 Tax=Amphiura filiformis TaxID=82378 RepID=UPI003B221CBC